MGLFRKKADLQRSCFRCRRADAKVWYAGMREVKPFMGKPEKRRVYACPACYYELPEKERHGWTVEASR